MSGGCGAHLQSPAELGPWPASVCAGDQTGQHMPPSPSHPGSVVKNRKIRPNTKYIFSVVKNMKIRPNTEDIFSVLRIVMFTISYKNKLFRHRDKYSKTIDGATINHSLNY